MELTARGIETIYPRAILHDGRAAKLRTPSPTTGDSRTTPPVMPMGDSPSSPTTTTSSSGILERTRRAAGRQGRELLHRRQRPERYRDGSSSRMSTCN